LKKILFAIFQKACKLVDGTGISRIPGVLGLYNFLFRRLWIHKSVIEVQGSQMYVNTEGLPKRYPRLLQSYITTNWEKLTTERFKEVVKDGDVVLDLGANMGYFTLLAAKLVGKSGKVYSFEPEPTNYSLLVKNIELNGYDNVVPVQKAVSNISGAVRLFVSEEDPGNSTIFQYGDGRKFVEIESVALDEFFKDKEHRVDVIKMDIEGAEMAALLGMDRIIRENKNLKIFSELLPSLMRAMGYSPEDFARKLMDDYHFSIQPIDRLPGRKTKHPSINSVDELMDLFEEVEVINLFLERI
jgi:FkbM family methyltransferase